MSLHVDLIIPDSGPLISLAHARRLDLVLVFDRPVVVADIVRLECLKKPDSPDHDVLADWFARAGNRVRILDTGMRGVFEAALERERTGAEPRATAGYGDAALAFMLRRLDLIAGPDAIPLVLLEDSAAAKALQRFERAHILSTRTWLNSLERARDPERRSGHRRNEAIGTLFVGRASGPSRPGRQCAIRLAPPSDRAGKRGLRRWR